MNQSSRRRLSGGIPRDKQFALQQLDEKGTATTTREACTNQATADPSAGVAQEETDAQSAPSRDVSSSAGAGGHKEATTPPAGAHKVQNNNHPAGNGAVSSYSVCHSGQTHETPQFQLDEQEWHSLDRETRSRSPLKRRRCQTQNSPTRELNNGTGTL